MANSGRNHDGANGEATGAAPPPGQRLSPYGQGTFGQRRPYGPGVQAHDRHLPPCPHKHPMGTLGARVAGPHPVLPILASCGGPGVRPAGCPGKGCVPHVPNLHSVDSQRRGGGGPCVPRGITPTMCDAPTSSRRCNVWWASCLCRCGCQVTAPAPPRYWCSARAGQGQGRWRPLPLSRVPCLRA